MPGTIDLSSVIAMMNQAASISEREANADLKINYSQPQELEPIQQPTKGKKKLEEASQPLKSLTSNMLPVNPEAQVMEMMNLDSTQQNYMMQVFDVVNTRNS